MKRIALFVLFCMALQGAFAQIGWQNDSWQVVSNSSSGGDVVFNSSGTFTVTNLSAYNDLYRADLASVKEVVLSEAEPYLFFKIKTTDGTLPSNRLLLHILNLSIDNEGEQQGYSIGQEGATEFIKEEGSNFYTAIWDLREVIGADFKDGDKIPNTNGWTDGNNPGSIRGFFSFKLMIEPASSAVPSYEVQKIKTYATIDEGKNDTSTVSEKPQVEAGKYQQVIFYGQSLSMGWEAGKAITTNSITGNYMLGSSPIMKYSNQSPSLTPLVATKWQFGGEQPIVSCVNVFATKYREEVDDKMNFIAMTGGEGGQTIERLSKECTNEGFYTSTFTKILDNTLLALDGSGSTLTCPAIVYMQGEHNSTSAGAEGKGLQPGTNGTTEKEEYKNLLLTLKNNMQADIVAKYGQAEKPTFFIYQTSGKYISSRQMKIAMAQLEFAKENDDVVMLNPHYAMPDYNAGHLSTNGYRWYGEIIGNILYKVLVKEEEYKPISPESFTFEENTLTIGFHVPQPPLKFDVATTPEVSNYGFKLTKRGYSTDLITKVEIVDGTKVKLTCSEELTGKIEISYGDVGTGNLCDSYSATSMYNYYDDSSASAKETYTPVDAEGNYLYGKKYSLKNWSVGFYYEREAVTGTTSISDAANGSKSYFDSLNEVFFNKNIRPGEFVRIFDLNGKVMLKELALKEKVNLSFLPRGIYIIHNGEERIKISK